MSLRPIPIVCPFCEAEFDLRQARAEAEWPALVELIMGLPEPVRRPIWDYLSACFKPAKQKHARVGTMLKAAREIAPLIKAAQVERNRTTYVVTAQEWADALTYLVQTPPPSLTLPLTGNGYLIGMLARQAEGRAAKAEAEAQAAKRYPYQEGRDNGPRTVNQVVETASQSPAAAPTKPERKPGAKPPAEFLAFLSPAKKAELKKRENSEQTNPNQD